MQISMEILSQLPDRADSGANVRQKTLTGATTIPKFQDLIRNKRPVIEYPVKTEGRNPGRRTIETDEDDLPQTRKKPDDKNNENLTAGVIGNQNVVVFILEGDKESAAFPEISINAVTAADTVPDEVIQTDEFEAEPVTAAPDTENEPVITGKGPEPEAISASDVMAAADRTEIDREPDRASKTDAVKTDAGNKAADTMTGEAMARTPEIRTSERQGNTGNSTDFSENGDLSPLENENDKAPVKEQKGKTYSETADAVRNKPQSAQEPANDTPMPLVDGIKPERFQAEQQMRQVKAEAPVKAENLFDEMVSRIETMQSENKSTMTIQLKPEFLGKVALEIAMDATGLRVRIDAADSSVRNIINGQMAALIESLENKGITVVEVEVAYTGVDNGAFKDSREGRAQQDHQRRSYRGIDAADSAEYYAALSFDALGYYLDEEVSSVEYRV